MRNHVRIAAAMLSGTLRGSVRGEDVLTFTLSGSDLAPLPVVDLRPKDLVRMENAVCDYAPRTHAKPVQRPKPAFAHAGKRVPSYKGPRGR